MPPGRSPALLAGLLGIALVLPGCAGSGTKAPKDRHAGMTAAQVYAAGMALMEKKSYVRARDVFQKALGRQDVTPDLTSRIHLALADTYFHDGGLINLAEALSRYTNFLTFYPNHERADYAQYQLGLCYLRQAASPDRDQQQTRKALNELSKVETLYPNSEYVPRAFEKSNEARELIAEHDFRIGYFYFRREAWPGAVDRFKEVLESFPNFSRKDEVYLLLGRSLIKVNRPDEARLYLEKLITEFPQSSHAAPARDLLERPMAGGVP